jgi:hypothetical protein
MKFGVAFDKPLTKADPDPTAPNKVAFVARGAYSTRGYARVSAGHYGVTVVGASQLLLSISRVQGTSEL